MHRRLPFSRGLDPEALALGPLERRDGQALLVHHEVVAVEPVVPGGLLALEGDVAVRRTGDRRAVGDRRGDQGHEEGKRRDVSWHSRP